MKLTEVPHKKLLPASLLIFFLFLQAASAFYDPGLQRWLNRDPSEEQGGMNLYAFCAQDPVNTHDALGLWNACGHNSILASAFAKAATDGFQLPKNDRNQFKRASHDMDDSKTGGQDAGNSYQHAMRAPDQDPSKARADADKFIGNQLQKAIDAQRAGDHEKAMYELGKGMHTIADRVSPAHEGEQPWPGLGIKNLPGAALHFLRELWPSPRRRDEAVNNLHDYYQQFQDSCSEAD